MDPQRNGCSGWVNDLHKITVLVEGKVGIPTQSLRFPGPTYESNDQDITQSDLLDAYCGRLVFTQVRREGVVMRGPLRRPGARRGSREFGAYFLLAGCSRR